MMDIEKYERVLDLAQRPVVGVPTWSLGVAREIYDGARELCEEVKKLRSKKGKAN